jgi:very-short-patch-repair endonuclease
VRRWRFDFAWPDRKVALEVEGGVWISGRHTRAAGYINDTEKYNEAVLLGWRVLRVTRPHIDSGQALQWVVIALENDGGGHA